MLHFPNMKLVGNEKTFALIRQFYGLPLEGRGIVVKDGDTGEVLLSGAERSPANENLRLGAVRVIPASRRLLVFEWQMEGKTYGSYYVTGFPPYPVENWRRWLGVIDALPMGETV